MLKISRLADYATVILASLANTPEIRQSASQVAEEIKLPTPTVSKVLKLLNEANLVNSSRGVNGGYQLSRSPEEISMADVVTAIDGDLAMTECSKEGYLCTRSQFCGLRHNWQTINSKIVSMLSQISLADMNHPLK